MGIATGLGVPPKMTPELAAYLASLGQDPGTDPGYDTGYDTGYDPGYDPGYAAAPAPVLATDPSWIALNQELDQSAYQAELDAGRKTQQIGATRDQLLADLIPRGEQERTGISGGMEARGLFGGGQMEESLARQRANEARRSTGIQQDSANQISDIEAALAAQKQQIEMQRASARAQYASQGYTA